ncbi:glycosyltransferase family 4 protein [Lichenihabitans psoromatis]|uniref:glycosyltransferase family 4 protein n=1 Tax=Lichenihabitans psoromatis TaxID=2528642 RepID=UPI00103598A4|nr:glycosyltransferase family 4 protein [Lichenihabitans psoromatis]
MKIAQIAPLMESVPPRLYGGTERIVSWLSEELVNQGHEVTLFASGDSMTSANLIPCTVEAIRLSETMKDYIPHTTMMVDKVRRMTQAFDIVHFHIDLFHFPLFRGIENKTITTLHGRQDLPDLWPFYRAFPKMPLVSISNAQRAPISDAGFAGTVLHGLPADLHTPNFEPRGGYLAFLGRISAEKRPDRAIEIAKALGIPLKIAAKVDKADEKYFREVIHPLIQDHPDVEFIGEVDERGKTKFLGEARALLFPIDWPEPFGLVMIEAMACGTPILAFRNGSVVEVIDDGLTGRIVDTVPEAIAALPEVLALDRRAVRRQFDQRFTAARMARDYVDLYQRQIDAEVASQRTASLRGAANLSIDTIVPASGGRFGNPVDFQ